MENIELIKNSILDNLDVFDLILDKIEFNKNKTVGLIEEIKIKDKNDEDVTSLIEDYRTNISLSFLLTEDLKRYGHVVNSYYRIAKLLNIDLEFNEELTKRLEHNLEKDKPYFIKDKQDLVSLESNLEENIKIGLKNNSNPNINQNILSIIRKQNEQKG